MAGAGYGYLFKPVTRKGPVFLARDQREAPTITTSDGRVIRAVRGDQAGGTFQNEGYFQWVFPREVVGLKDFSLSYGGEKVNIADGRRRHEGNGFTDLTPAAGKGNAGSGVPSDLQPGTDETGLGFSPADLRGEFPSPVLADFQPTETAPYEFTDPAEFTKGYAPTVRDQFIQNNRLAGEFARDVLDSEIGMLEDFVPRAADLKRGQISLDNLFNQEERSRQIDTTLPSARGDLEAQRKRAGRYAEGRLPEDMDRGFAIGVGSDAADIASSSGFGAGSSTARKASDLMSARERFQIAQYGEGLSQQNRTEAANLLLAPTEYSNAGSQISVNPSISPAQLITQGRAELNRETIVPASQAFASKIEQNQFTTGLEQQTRQFNASGMFQESTFNATTRNQFSLAEFGYKVDLAGAIAGAAQTGSNAKIEIEQQKAALDLYRETLKAAQSLKNIQGIFSGLTSLIGAFGGIEKFVDALQKLGERLGIDFGDDEVESEPIAKQPTSSPNSEPPDDSPSSEPIAQQPSDSPNSEPPAEEDPSGDSGGPVPPPPDESVGSDEPEPDTQFSARRAALKKSQSDLDRRTNETADQYVDRLAQAKPYGAMKAAGLSSTPGQNKTRIGYDNRGKPVYTDNAAAQSNDRSEGGKHVDTFLEVLNPFGIFSPEDTSFLKRVGQAAGDAGFYGSLALAASTGNKKEFINLLLNKFQVPKIQEAILGKPKGEQGVKDRAGLNAAIDAAQLFANWDNLSDAQKSRAIASIGIQGYQAFTGKDIRAIELVPAGAGRPGLNVGQALRLVGNGIDIYNLVNNWNDYDDVNKVVGGLNTTAGLINSADSLGLLAAGEGSAGAGIAASTGTAATAGAGASTGTAAVGTSAATTEAGVAGTGITGGDIAVGASQVAGVATVALGAHTVRKNWGTGGPRGRAAGAVGGGTMALGLSSLGVSNPYVYAGVMAVSILGTSIKTGKHSDQVLRDRVRKNLREVGFTDENNNVTLADGSKADIGIDGNGGQHEARSKEGLVKGGRSKMNAYDIDYTNDLDYASGMAGIALSRISAGGTDREVDKIGGQLGNVALQGYGKDFTQENFNKVMENHRALYAQRGVKSKEEAYRLSIDLMNEGRVSQAEAVAMQQAFNMMYDRDGYSTAQRLMNGRHRGLEVAANKESIDPGFNRPRPGDTSGTRRPTFDRPEGQRPGSIDPGFNRPRPRGPDRIDTKRELDKARPYRKLRTKEEIRAANRRRYAA